MCSTSSAARCGVGRPLRLAHVYETTSPEAFQMRHGQTTSFRPTGDLAASAVVGRQAPHRLSCGAAQRELCAYRNRIGSCSHGPRSPGTRSTAPTSHAAPCGRVTPRWSLAGQPELVPWSTAGLPSTGRCVSVGPPLAPSGPSPSLTLSRPPPKPHEPSSERLESELAGATTKPQLAPVAPAASSTFFRLSVGSGPPPTFSTPPVSPKPAVLPASVTFVRLSRPRPL